MSEFDRHFVNCRAVRVKKKVRISITALSIKQMETQKTPVSTIPNKKKT